METYGLGEMKSTKIGGKGKGLKGTKLHGLMKSHKRQSSKKLGGFRITLH
jgi:hypothetical protein